ncbi:hypothetical protein RHMOL_Rhmol13G0195300 [Rhododendron molle]|uniref:Uncharacterized protein n=1 Tax=Rhododendron molle TaxID=49168 RepID=A0ACC0L8Z4_RHOML|nr:hypothetical protein RHMOL_Rhmol13G0195300 [Rhododendron molle]
MGSRIPSHQLSSGLYVSGRPDHLPKSPQPTMSSRAVPYTGGDIKTSGELGKMFDLTTTPTPTTLDPTPTPRSRLSSSSQHNSGSVRSGPNSGPILHPTGLITSGPLTSSAGRRSGQLDPSGSIPRAAYGSAVTKLGDDGKLGFNVSKLVMWVVVVAAAMGLLVGVFLLLAVKKAVVLVAVAGVLAPVVVVVVWNFFRRRRGLLGFFRKYPDAELRGAVDGQYVKVTGLETSCLHCKYTRPIGAQQFEFKGRVWFGCNDVKVGFNVSKLGMWVAVVAMGLLVRAFLMVAVKKVVVLVTVAGVLVLMVVWNFVWRKGLLGFFKKYPDAEL